MRDHNSHRTAIARKTLPRPTQWLLGKGFITDHPMISILDFGCGKCESVNPKSWDNYDPHFKPQGIPGGKKYLRVVCNYVLCTLSRATRKKILKEIQSHLTEFGEAYISVRNDKPKQGWGISSRGTYQGRVQDLKLPLLHSNSQFRIYSLTKTTKLN